LSRWTFAALLCLIVFPRPARPLDHAILNALLDSAIADFERGRIDQSVATFDQLVAGAAGNAAVVAAWDSPVLRGRLTTAARSSAPHRQSR
jgi:hypothetical protein